MQGCCRGCLHVRLTLFVAFSHAAACRQTTEELIAKCKAMVDAEEAASFEEGYINEADPSGGFDSTGGMESAGGGWRLAAEV